MKSFCTSLIERNFSFKEWYETFNVRDFWLIKSGNLTRVSFIFNNFYHLLPFYSLEGFKNRTIMLRDLAQIKSTFELATFYSKYALVILLSMWGVLYNDALLLDKRVWTVYSMQYKYTTSPRVSCDLNYLNSIHFGKD